MFQHQHRSQSHRTTRGPTLTTAAVLTVLALGAGPAAARPDDGFARASVRDAGVCDPGRCPLERVGTQFVRGDDLTGNGVPAPAWIPEQ